MCQWYQFTPHSDGGIFLLGGAERTEVGVAKFRQSYRLCRPKYAVSVAPLGVDMSDGQYDCMQMVGSALFGDILGSVWKIGVWGWGKNALRMPDGPGATQFAKRWGGWGGRYSECCILAARDERGVIHHRTMQFSGGLDVTITNEQRRGRFSVDSGVGLLGPQITRNPDPMWPLVVGADGELWGNLRQRSDRCSETNLGGEKCYRMGKPESIPHGDLHQ